VVAAVVVIERGQMIAGVNDSKKLSEQAREAAFELIIEQAVDYAIAEATPAEIDRLNILQATMLAMRRAVENLRVTPQKIRVDGNRCPDLGVLNPIAEPLVGGDGLCIAIGAASILAKVTRDRQMLALDARYPEYGFARHKGYPTALHREILEQHGPCPEHRRSFRPVREAALLRGSGVRG
jgi:ribonuclease HII